jgi:hypothetical protein
MKLRILLLLSFLLISGIAIGQENPIQYQGQITFITTENVYVRFDDTANIKVGDSLQLASSSTSCFLVKSKSTTSCVCSAVEGCAFEKGDEVIFVYKPAAETHEAITEMAAGSAGERDMLRMVGQPEEPPEEEEPMYKEVMRGSISLSEYSLLNSDRADRHRIMSRFDLDARHINNSRFSFDTYLNYRYILDGEASSSLPSNNYLRVYNLSGRMDVSPTLSLTLGRNINPKASSLGAIDGLQAEKQFGATYLGAIVGFRPDFYDYGFNSDLLQYGGYFGLTTDEDDFRSQSTFGFMEQRANGDIDRRYIYLQHFSTLFKNLNLFSSAEMDIYSKVNYTTTNDFRLTNLYVSARYRFSRQFSLMLSYDSRKRILYYETFQSDIERLLDDDLARQGARASVSFRPFKYIYAGASYAKRFQSDQQNKSDNINAYLTFSRIPGIGGRLNLNYNQNSSNYLESNVGAIRYSRDFMDNRMYAGIYYRIANYQYGNIMDPLLQHYVGTDISYNITRKLQFSISAEYTTYNNENNFRFYTNIIQRFNTK